MTRIGDRFEVVAPLRKSGSAVLYLAYDEKLKCHVEVKVLLPALSADERVRQLFHREARALCSLRHPNILDVIDYSGRDAPELFLVTQHRPGWDLAEIQPRVLSEVREEAILCLVHEVALALAHLAERDLVHRDVAPENVLVDQAGWVSLTGFDIARGSSSGDLQGTLVADLGTQSLGSPDYISPEAAAGESLTPAADLFALASLWHFMLAGRPPFSALQITETLENIESGNCTTPVPLEREASDEMMNVLERCHRPEPSERPSAAALAGELASLLAGRGYPDIRQGLADLLEPQRLEATVISARARLTTLPDQQSSALLTESTQPAVRLPSAAQGVTQPAVRLEATAPAAQRLTEPVTQGVAQEARPGRLIAAGVAALGALLLLLFWGVGGGHSGEVVELQEVPSAANGPAAVEPAAAVEEPRVQDLGDGLPEPGADDDTIVESDPSAAPVRSPRAKRTGPGRLTITVEPWAVVFIDGHAVGKTPLSAPLELAPGEHLIKLVHSGYPIVERKLRISAGRSRKLHFDLAEVAGKGSE